MAMKFHSGRLVDIRDVIALMPCDENELKKHVLKCNLEKLKGIIKHQKMLLDNPQFKDSFKGIFGLLSYNEDNVKAVKQLIQMLLNS